MVLGPFLHEELSQMQISQFGVIPKASQPGKWRLIVNLSHPEGKSVNNGIDSELCSLQYVKVDDVARMVWRLGPGTQMAKIDIKSAYRIVPVHPQDRCLLGMKWDGTIWAMVGPENLQCASRRVGMDCPATGCGSLVALPGRLHHVWAGRFR